MKKFRLVEFTVVEPSADEITSFKKLVEEQKKALNGVTFHWRQESLQDFCKANADSSKRFHFVSALHSLYFIQNKDLDFYLKTIFGWTEGKMLIMQGAGKYVLCSLGWFCLIIWFCLALLAPSFIPPCVHWMIDSFIFSLPLYCFIQSFWCKITLNIVKSFNLYCHTV